MPIDLHSRVDLGSLSGIIQRHNDLTRRVQTLENNRTIIGAGSIGSAQLGQDSVTDNQVANNAIRSEHIAATQIVAGHLTAGIITTSYIEAGAIKSHLIDALAINAGHIQALAINAGHIQANSIETTHIVSGAIQTGLLAAGAVTTTKLDAEAVTADKIAAGAVNASHIVGDTLEAISSNMGSLTAGTITGATVRTSASGARVVMDSTGLRGYALNGITKVFEINAGTGVASFTGVANIDPASVIPGGTITQNTLPGDRIVSNSIKALQIQAGAIETNHIKAGAVTAQKISLDWAGSNLLNDSSFEDVVSPGAGVWSVEGGVFSRVKSDVIPVDGEYAAKVVADASSISDLVVRGSTAVGASGDTYGGETAWPGLVAVLPNRKYTFSAYVASASAVRQVRAQIAWKDALHRTTLERVTIVSAEASAGGSLPAGNYEYAITVQNTFGSTNARTVSLKTVTVADNQKVTLDASVPIDAPGTPYPITGVRVYRRLAGGAWSGYYTVTHPGASTFQFVDTGSSTDWTASTTGPSEWVNGAYTTAEVSTSGASISTELPTTLPGTPDYVTSPTVVTGPAVVTGAAPAARWARWVRPTVTATPPAGAAYACVVVRMSDTASGEIHYFDAFQLENGEIATGFAPKTGEIVPGSVGPTQITPNSITTDQIKTRSLMASDIWADELSAISANLGEIEAGSITGVTITGSVVRTANSGARTEMNSGGLFGFNNAEQPVFSLAGGVASMVGTISSGFTGTARGVLSAGALQGLSSDNAVQMNLSFANGTLDLYNGYSAAITLREPNGVANAALLMRGGAILSDRSANGTISAIYPNTVEVNATWSTDSYRGFSTVIPARASIVASNQAGESSLTLSKDGAYLKTPGQESWLISPIGGSRFLRLGGSNDGYLDWCVGYCDFNAYAGVTSNVGYVFNFGVSGTAVMANQIRSCWIELHTNDYYCQARVWPNGSPNSVGCSIYNGSGYGINMSGHLFVLGY